MQQNQSPAQQILYFPLTKIIIGLAVCVSAGFIGQVSAKFLLNITSLSETYKNPVIEFVTMLLVMAAYATLYKFYEKRSITELSVKRPGRNFIPGALLGLILQSLTIYIMYLNKGFSVIAVNPFMGVLPFLVMVFADSVTGQILLTGIIFRIIEEKLGSYLALIILALIFGTIHFASPNGSAVAAFSIPMHAGFLLGAAYIFSRSLWFPIAIHFAWDFAQAGIFGANMSGNINSNSLLVTQMEGPALISGGYFGPQASVQAGLLCLTAALALLILSHRKNKIIQPWWRS